MQKPGAIPNGAGKRPNVIEREGQAHNAIAADLRLRRFYADYTARGGRQANGPTGIRAESAKDDPAADGGAGTT